MSNQPLTTERYSLAPRTPHSRSGRFEDIDITDPDVADLDDNSGSQEEPLLGTRLQDLDETKDRSTNNWGAWAPLAALAILLLLLLGTSVLRPGPDILHQGLEGDQTATVDSEQPPSLPADFSVISYENYTAFPLTPSQYRDECQKMTPVFMSVHRGYWAPAKSDVLHHPVIDRTCKSTITYMLGGGVGLLADLALMAQAAGLAREVSSFQFAGASYRC